MEDKEHKNSLKKYLVSGLFAILPLWLTVWVIKMIFDLISSVSMPILQPVFDFIISDSYWVSMLHYVSSFFLTLLIIVFIGFFTTKLIGKKIFDMLERLFFKLPLIGDIYSALKKLFSFFSNKDKNMNFQKVVFVPFPSKDIYCVAFSTGEKILNGQKYITCFMPTTPNPTTGFLMLIKESDVIESNYSVEDAIQYIISAGIITPQNKNAINMNLEK